MAQPPSPHAMTGSLSSPGNPPRSSGRKTTWPGEPGAGSDLTLYGPGIAFGAPSSGSVVLTRSALRPGPWANDTHAVRTNAVVSADFMRRSLPDGTRLAHAAADGERSPRVDSRRGESYRTKAASVSPHACRKRGVTHRLTRTKSTIVAPSSGHAGRSQRHPDDDKAAR